MKIEEWSVVYRVKSLRDYGGAKVTAKLFTYCRSSRANGGLKICCKVFFLLFLEVIIIIIIFINSFQFGLWHVVIKYKYYVTINAKKELLQHKPEMLHDMRTT